MPRTVTIRATTDDLVGDETFEAWLKHESDAWILVDAGDVDQLDGGQDFIFPGLIDGAHYSLQLRMKRTGRYRVGYLSADPETWPSESRLDFTVGSLIGVGAPTLVSVSDWVRTSSSHSQFTIEIEPDDISQDLELVRDGAVIHTFVAPLDYTIEYDDIDAPLGETHTYRARHIAGTLGGPFSGSIAKYAGPGPVMDLIQADNPNHFNNYELQWTNDGRTYRVEDDYLCGAEFALVPGGSAVTVADIEIHYGSAELPEGPTVDISVRARVRAEVTSFSVTDYSAWTEQSITAITDETGSEYNTCP